MKDKNLTSEDIQNQLNASVEKIEGVLCLLKQKYQKLSDSVRKVWQNILFDIEAKRSFNIEGVGTSLEQMQYARENIVNNEKKEYKAINIEKIFKIIWEEELHKSTQELTSEHLSVLWKELEIFVNDEIKNKRRDQIQKLFPREVYVSITNNRNIYFLNSSKIENELNWWFRFFNNSALTNLSEWKHHTLLNKCWILHHYFEVIHPFPDGNGRMGRILISLFFSKYNLWIEDWICPLSAQIYYKRSEYLAKLNFSKIQKKQNNQLTEHFWRQQDYDDQQNYFFNLKYDFDARNEYFLTMNYFFLNTIKNLNKAIDNFLKQRQVVEQIMDAWSFKQIAFFHRNKSKKIVFLDLIFSQLIFSKKEIIKKLECDPRTVVKIMEISDLKIYFGMAQYQKQIFYHNREIVKIFKLKV